MAADKRISELDSAASLDGSESLEAVQIGNNVKILLSTLRTYIEINSVIANTALSTITLILGFRVDNIVIGSASIATNKILAIADSTGSLRFTFLLKITAAVDLTIPADWVIDAADPRWARPTLSLLDVGEYEITGKKNTVTSNWIINVSLNKN
jgi:hypothetical protein